MEQVELYRNSDVGRIDYAVACGDQTQYPSGVGYNLHEMNAAEAHSPFERALVENLRTLIDKGIVPHRVAMRHAHAIGIRFYYMFRMALGGVLPPFSPSSRLFVERPDLRMVDRDGTPLPKLSFAFPEVQQHMLDIMEEVIDDEVDGINICWMRGLRVIGYETPVVEAFETAYDEDIRSVPESDERIHRLQAGFLTDFMRRVRQLANEAGSKRGRPLAITAMVGGVLWLRLFGAVVTSRRG